MMMNEDERRAEAMKLVIEVAAASGVAVPSGNGVLERLTQDAIVAAKLIEAYIARP